MPQPDPTLTSGYAVVVADNFHYMNEEETYVQGLYVTYEEALTAARNITLRSLIEGGGESIHDILDHYRHFGDDPYIVPFGEAPPPEERFSAWTFAEQIAPAVWAEKNGPSKQNPEPAPEELT